MNTRLGEFDIDGTRLILEDRVSRFDKTRGERILWIAGTSAFYSAVPLDPDSHELLCFEYCAQAMKTRPPQFYHHALVLGCGGGAIPRWLLEEYPSIKVDIVDRSEQIISICREYFLDRWDDCGRLNYYCVDAADFDSEDDYQLIFCDLFNGEEVAQVVYNKDFAAKLRRLAGDEGILVVNCGWDSPKRVNDIYSGVFEYVQTVPRQSWQTQVIKASGSKKSVYG